MHSILIVEDDTSINELLKKRWKRKIAEDLGLFRNRSQDASADEQLQCGAVRPDASRNSRGRGSKGNQEKRKHTGDCAYCQRHH